jgi:anaerobic magnesium-protoporphyrin IX monomethyl ester cyclase
VFYEKFYATLRVNMQKDIILINPPISEGKWVTGLGSKLPPLGLGQLASVIVQNGIKTDLLDATNLGLNIKDVINKIKLCNPKYVGITASSTMIYYASNLAQEIKRHLPHIKTIIGGPHISAMPIDTMKRFTAFDLGVFGEGERTLLDIFEKEEKYNEIDGLLFRSGDEVVKNNHRELIKDLDELPFPAYELFPNYPDFYIPTPNNYTKFPVASMVSSRGCPYSCSFCSQSVFGKKMRSFTIDYIIAHMKELKGRYKIEEICFYDDIFLLKKAKLYEFIEKKKQNNVDLMWSCEARIDQLDTKTLHDMKEARCWQVSFGVESGSKKVLDYYCKKITPGQIRNAINITHQAKIKIRAYLIVGAPVENKETLKDTENLVLSSPIDDIHVAYFTPLPGSPAYDDLLSKTKNDYIDTDHYSINYTPPGIEKEELVAFLNSLYRKFYFHPKRLYRYFLMLFNFSKTWHLIKAAFCFIILTIIEKDA